MHFVLLYGMAHTSHNERGIKMNYHKNPDYDGEVYDIIQKSKKMREWACSDCGHLVIASDRPQPIRWTDGHICHFIEVIDDPVPPHSLI